MDPLLSKSLPQSSSLPENTLKSKTESSSLSSIAKEILETKKHQAVAAAERGKVKGAVRSLSPVAKGEFETLDTSNNPVVFMKGELYLHCEEAVRFLENPTFSLNALFPPLNYLLRDAGPSEATDKLMNDLKNNLNQLIEKKIKTDGKSHPEGHWIDWSEDERKEIILKMSELKPFFDQIEIIKKTIEDEKSYQGVTEKYDILLLDLLSVSEFRENWNQLKKDIFKDSGNLFNYFKHDVHQDILKILRETIAIKDSNAEKKRLFGINNSEPIRTC